MELALPGRKQAWGWVGLVGVGWDEVGWHRMTWHDMAWSRVR